MSSSLENATSTCVIGYARPVLLIIAVLALTGIGLGAFPSAAKDGRAIPAPALDEPHDATFEVAVLAGGCFWGVQGVYQHVRGVTNAVSGYSGGDKETAQYQTVSTGTTAHAESVKITSIQGRSPMAASCRSISRSPMIRPSSTGRGRTRVPNIVRRSSRHQLSRLGLRKPTSPN